MVEDKSGNNKIDGDRSIRSLILQLLEKTLNKIGEFPAPVQGAIIVGSVALLGIMIGVGSSLVGETMNTIRYKRCTNRHTDCDLELSLLRSRNSTLEAICAIITPTKTKTPTTTPSIVIPPTWTKQPTVILTQTAIATITLTPSPTSEYTMAISEIVHVPSAADGLSEHTRWNEYVELYNFGNKAINVEGLWLSDGDSSNFQPDQIVAWSDRYRAYNFGEGVITNSTEIPPGGYALILSPRYLYLANDQPYDNRIEAGTLILSIAKPESPDDPDLLGDLHGLEGFETATKLDFVILYQGTRFKIKELISTYGAPDVTEGDSPFNVSPTLLSGFPKSLSFLGGVRRKDPTGPDVIGNWEVFDWGKQTPGY
jgi:hypothetical protein